MRHMHVVTIAVGEKGLCGDIALEATDIKSAYLELHAMPAEIDRLRAALTWQPIETAPCDVRVMLATPTWFGSSWDFSAGMIGQGRDYNGAKFWMPLLPSPPEAGQ